MASAVPMYDDNMVIIICIIAIINENLTTIFKLPGSCSICTSEAIAIFKSVEHKIILDHS